MKKYNIIWFATLLLFLAGCQKSWLNVNTDPNNPTTAAPEFVLPSATLGVAGVVGGYYNLLGGMWSQYWTQSPGSNQYKYIDGYHLLNTDFQDQWTTMYTDGLVNLQNIIQQSLIAKNYSFVFMGTVLQCYAFEDLVDLYDQIPFNQALGGAQGVLNPKFDPSITVYDSIAARLQHLSSLDLSSPLTASQQSADFMFNGNMAQWKAFANTLLLKIYLRQMYVRPDTAKNGIARLYAAGANFLTTDAYLNIFINQPNKDNPLYESDRRDLNTAVNIRASATLFKYLLANNDPRLWKIDGTGTDGNTVPTPTPSPQGGYNLVYTGPQIAAISVAIVNATDPVYFLSEAESYFLQAEAVAMGWGTTVNGTDAALYYAGMNASFVKFGLDSAGNTSPYPYPTTGTFEQKQKAIIMQKWISMAGSEGLEAFFETNRTHYPADTSLTYNNNSAAYQAWTGGALMYSLDGATGGLFPKRLLFPNIERQENNNTPPEVPLTQKVWWDVKP